MNVRAGPSALVVLLLVTMVLQDRREWRINVAWLTGEIELDEHPE